MEPEGVYRHTRTRTGAVAPVDYSALARGIEVSESHSVIAESQASNTSIKKEVFASMTNTPEETAGRLEQHAQVQREQFDMIRAQQESIDALKQMLAQLLEDKRKSTGKTSSKKSKGKWKEGKAPPLYILRRRGNLILSRLNPHLKRKVIQRMGVLILKE